MSKILLILPFVFVFIGIFTVIYIIYTTINEKRRKKLRDEEFKKIKENLFLQDPSPSGNQGKGRCQCGYL